MTSGIAFEVDDVAPAADRLPALDAQGIDRAFGGAPIAMGVSAGELVSASTTTPALLETVHLAFSAHRPLVLTPDAIWLTLAAGLAIHLRENAHTTERLVRHEGKKTLSVEGGDGTRWDEIVDRFAEAMASDTGPGLVSLFTTSFSTTTPVDRTASRILLMEGMKRHFEYETRCICGIPSIRLAGTVADWRDIKRRVEVMSELDLSWWTTALLPLCDRWIATAEGRPDRAFWQSIYKPRAAYGADLVTGWLVRLFPYLEERELAPNDFAPLGAGEMEDDGGSPMQALVRRMTAVEARRTAWRRERVFPTPQCSPDEFLHSPIGSGAFPSGRTNVEVRVRWPHGESDVVLAGGLLGVAQDPTTLALAPASGWVVSAAPTRTAAS